MTRPVSICARAVELPALTPADVVRLASALPESVVLAGEWAAGDITLAADPIRLASASADPFAALDDLPVITGDIPADAIGGGWFGWLGFEPGANALGFYPNVLRRKNGQWSDEALLGVLDDAELELRRQTLVDALRRPVPRVGYRLGTVAPSRTLAGHAAAVERAIQHIRAGEIYQANICLTLRAPFAGSAAQAAADLLSGVEPRYGAFVSIGAAIVASASPELFLRRTGRHVLTQPIKGTRPRAGTDASAEAGRLAGSDKDRAENVMIVDLMRNDLSRVSEVGSVRVSGLLDVVPAPGVWHLVSGVEAQLRDGVTDGELLRAAFPPGSVSGVPKSRAVEVIAELEDGPRGVYTGAIGYVSPASGAEFSVAIRTASIAGEEFRLGVGGGITVDSTPAQEWWECFDKAWPLLRAVDGRVDDPAASRPSPDPRAAKGVFDTCLVRGGEPIERAEHLARLQRSLYELYQAPLPAHAAEALTSGHRTTSQWERQRIDVSPTGQVRITRSEVASPITLDGQEGADAIAVAAATGFGPHKWSGRERQTLLEEAHPGQVVIVADRWGLLESTRANVVGVVDGRLVTPPLDGRILPGVTRTTLLEIARDIGVEFALEPLDPQGAQALATVGSVAGMRWIRCCETDTGLLRWDGPGALLTELSRRLIHRWACGVTVRG
ncbi:MAG TPA: bifunctional anthranilate synthase component I family protein/class IV aminotransferase [Frankiaceae bacterium]|jgi:para-aminobenzoate synthetase/4-amino-4-deoxychorismate lyase|nr:bifunctional anthranilate synthase component I family protein/class IV aminotransferase [Frankiaceae bacterium]